MERQPRSTPTTLVDGASEHRDSHTLGRRDRGNHRRFSGALVRGRTDDPVYRRLHWGHVRDLWPIVLDQAVKAIVDAAECVSSPTDSPMSPVGGESVFSV